MQTSEIKQAISDLLEKQGEDFLSVAQIRSKLPAAVLEKLGLNRKSLPAEVLKQLKPALGAELKEYRGPKAKYIGHALSPEAIILKGIQKTPGLSSKSLAQRRMPLVKRDFIPALNRLLESGQVLCTFNLNHIPVLVPAPSPAHPVQPADSQWNLSPEAARAAFKQAYDQIGKGRGFVRIHRLREALNWPRDRFDELLTDLMADYVIELHGGDPSVMSEGQIRDSFVDDTGVLYITLTWWGESHASG